VDKHDPADTGESAPNLLTIMAETFSQGNVPWWTNTERQLEAKILNAIGSGGGGGTGGAGVVGAGSPEGVVTAPPGTSYFDSVDKVFWIKQTGTGNTGWYQLVG
jgi:hypothetical protein